ncbi:MULTISPECIES: hypothetical protein [unclassified Bradyrhizobium]|uniref:hypothetical protein n=1 Tax=unclassified Bradyrhizobium TaxID=2631580 RepID=UPI0023066FE6|nr:MULTISPECIES: hypothetical protein [unclassified Bradyrhizobium]
MEDISDPMPCPEAFFREGLAAICSRAALLMALGLSLSPPEHGVIADLDETAPFPIPSVAPVSESLDEELDVRGIYRRFSRLGGLERQIEIEETVRTLYREDRRREKQYLAVKLLALHLTDNEELLRVCATVSWLDVAFSGGPNRRSTSDYTNQLATLLKAARRSRDDVTRAIAMTALGRMSHLGNNSPTRLYRFLQANREDQQTFWLSIGDFIRRIRQRAAAGRSEAETTIVHGTIFSFVGSQIDKWWRPRTGDLHIFLTKQLPQAGLYSRSDYFRWSGGWSDPAREEAADRLVNWIVEHRFEGKNVIAHSHGSNVLIRAVEKVKLGTIVLLSCPVQPRRYGINFQNVKRIVSIRVKWDLIIMADRGRQRFDDARIQEIILPIWFGRHGTTRRSSTWRDENLMRYL